MRRSKCYLLVCLLILLLTIYFAFDALYVETASEISLSIFLALYIDNSYRYFFLISLFTILIMYALNLPFLQPEYLVRISPDRLVFVAKFIVNMCLVSSFSVYAIFALVSVFFKFNIAIDYYYLIVLLKLLCMNLSINILYVVMYVNFTKMGLSLLLTFGGNYLYLTAINYWEFTTNNYRISETGYYVYVIIVCVVGIPYLLLFSDKIEPIVPKDTL